MLLRMVDGRIRGKKVLTFPSLSVSLTSVRFGPFVSLRYITYRSLWHALTLTLTSHPEMLTRGNVYRSAKGDPFGIPPRLQLSSLAPFSHVKSTFDPTPLRSRCVDILLGTSCSRASPVHLRRTTRSVRRMKLQRRRKSRHKLPCFS